MTAAPGPLTVFRSRAVVGREGIVARSIHVREGRIARIADYDDLPAGAEVDDLGDLVVLPGVVDTHVHINEPGRTEWEGFATATRAAAAGGVTTLIEMPLNAVPPTTTVAGLHAKREAAAGKLSVDVGFWGGVVPGNARDLEPLWRDGVFGFKAFLCPSGVNEFPAASEADLRTVLPILAHLGAPLLAHAESPDVLLKHGPAAGTPLASARKYATYLATRPPEAEVAAIDLLLRVAGEFGGAPPLHVVHLATTDALPLLANARRRGIRVSAETCPHYLYFASEDIPDGATAYKCAPPIRDRRTREGLWEALGAGAIDLIATDHSPCSPALKREDSGSFLDAWGGIASLQLGLAVVWSAARRRGFTLVDVVRWMCEAPARLAGLTDRGTLAEGYRADLVAFDPDGAWEVDRAGLFHRHPVTPYHGACLTGRVEATFLAGRCVFRHGESIGPPRGQLLLRSS